MNNLSKSKNLTLTAMLGAIIFILTFTPLGFIPLPIVNATTIHIPVILGSLLMGPKYGAALGFMFGFASLLRSTFMPGLTAFVFSPFYPLPWSESGSWAAPLVAFIPRILVGITPWLCYRALVKVFPKGKSFETANYAISGVVGSLTNTIFVLHFIYIFFRVPYASVLNQSVDVIYSFIMGIILSNGVPEAVVAGILIAALGRAFSVILREGR